MTVSARWAFLNYAMAEGRWFVASSSTAKGIAYERMMAAERAYLRVCSPA